MLKENFAMLFPDDPHFSMEFARDRLAPIHTRLLDCVRRAWRTIQEACSLSETVGPALEYSGARAHLMNALVVEEIRREFSPRSQPESSAPGCQEFNPVDFNGFMELRVCEGADPVRIDLRFKKCDADGVTMNSDTPAQRQYRNLLPFSGIGDANSVLRLSLTWQWDAAASSIADVCVKCVKGYEVEWSYSILNDADEGRSEGVLIPTPAPAPSGGVRYRRAGASNGAKKTRRKA